MNIPITKRVQQGGGKKDCGCGKAPAKKALVGNQDQLPEQLQNAIKAAPGKMYDSPAKMWGAAKVAHGKKSSPAKMGCYGKKK
jgi:hypothetical protein